MFNTPKKYFMFALTVTYFLLGSASYAFAAQDSHNHESQISAKYQCPMHPQIVSDKPGVCPICHMTLVLIKRNESPLDSASLEDLTAVAIDKSGEKLVNIRTESVEMKPLMKTIEGWGTIAHDPELYQLQIDFLREERLNYERGRDRTIVARKRSLTGREKIEVEFSHMGLSTEWVNALEEAGIPDKRLIFHHRGEGQWAYIQFREKDAAILKKGDLVVIKATGFENLKLDGRIEFIDGLVDESTRTVRVRVLIKNEPEFLKPNMTVSATTEIDLGSALVISENAPLFMGNRVIVFVEESGKFKPREVTLGAKAQGYYEVKEGLKVGEKIVSSGNFFIDSESKLRSATDEGTGHEGHES